MLIDLVCRADGNKGAADGGKIRAVCKADCDRVEYGPAGISATIYGVDDIGQQLINNCPPDCIVEVIGGRPEYYQAEVIATKFHGGARPGAGRPVTGRKQTKFFLTDEEKSLVKQYIESIRK